MKLYISLIKGGIDASTVVVDNPQSNVYFESIECCL